MADRATLEKRHQEIEAAFNRGVDELEVPVEDAADGGRTWWKDTTASIVRPFEELRARYQTRQAEHEVQRALRGADAAEEDDRELKWPFGTSDDGPLFRPLLPNLDNVLIAIVDDADEGQRIVTALHELGLAEERVRPYTAEQILAHNEIIRANRGCKGRLIGALVDERKAIADYVAYAREGRSAVWVLVDDRYHTNRVIRLMADYGVMLVRYYDDSNRVEDVHMRLPPGGQLFTTIAPTRHTVRISTSRQGRGPRWRPCRASRRCISRATLRPKPTPARREWSRSAGGRLTGRLPAARVAAIPSSIGGIVIDGWNGSEFLDRNATDLVSESCRPIPHTIHRLAPILHVTRWAEGLVSAETPSWQAAANSNALVWITLRCGSAEDRAMRSNSTRCSAVTAKATTTSMPSP